MTIKFKQLAESLASADDLGYITEEELNEMPAPSHVVPAGVTHKIGDTVTGTQSYGRGKTRTLTGKVTAMGAKHTYVHPTQQSAKDAGVVRAHYKILHKDVVKEETQIAEAATVKTQKYSWGTMKTVHHGADFSIPLHPEHHQAIAKLKDQQEHKFKDETGHHWVAKRKGDHVHFDTTGNGSMKTHVPLHTMKEDLDVVEEVFEEIEDQNFISFSQYINEKRGDEAEEPGEEGEAVITKRADRKSDRRGRQYPVGLKVHNGDDDGNGDRLGEEAELEEGQIVKTKTGIIHKGTYGSEYDTDEEGNEKKKEAPAVKRGRGRPKKGSDETGNVKKYTFHSLLNKLSKPSK